MIWISVVSIAFLFLIALTDIKTRQIPIIFLTTETIASFFLSYNLIGCSIWKDTIINFSLILFQILSLWCWIKISQGKLSNGLWSKFGKGDVFMLGISAINLSTLNFLSFTIVICITSILIWVGLTTIGKFNDRTIPFAGFMALGLMTIRILQLITGFGLSFCSDNYILNLIYGIY